MPGFRLCFDHITPSSIFKYPIVHKSVVDGVPRYNCRLCGVEEGEGEESTRKLIAAEHFFAFDVVEIRGVLEPGEYSSQAAGKWLQGSTLPPS